MHQLFYLLLIQSRLQWSEWQMQFWSLRRRCICLTDDASKPLHCHRDKNILYFVNCFANCYCFSGWGDVSVEKLLLLSFLSKFGEIGIYVGSESRRLDGNWPDIPTSAVIQRGNIKRVGMILGQGLWHGIRACSMPACPSSCSTSEQTVELSHTCECECGCCTASLDVCVLSVKPEIIFGIYMGIWV